MLMACEADFHGRRGWESRSYPEAQQLSAALDAALATTLEPDERAGLRGEEIAAALRARRVAAIAVTRD
jgi:tRNA nucleotidyltransferase (CCA-adding enzyme)